MDKLLRLCNMSLLENKKNIDFFKEALFLCNDPQQALLYNYAFEMLA